MRAGSIDGYHARRNLLRPGGTPLATSLAVRDLGRYGFPNRALVLVTASSQDDGSTRAAALSISTSPDICVGSTDERGAIDRVSPEIESLLGLRQDVHESDVRVAGAPGRRASSRRRAHAHRLGYACAGRA